MDDSLVSKKKTPPCDPASERFVIGCGILEQRLAEKICLELKEIDFYYNAHQKIFKVFEDLLSDGKEVCLVNVKELLKKKGLLEEIGGISYLLSMVEPIVTTSNINSHILVIKEKSFRRQIIQKSIQLAQSSYDEMTDCPSIVSCLEELSSIELFSKRKQRYFTMPELTEECRETTEKILNSNNESVINTGFVDLDGLICGLSIPDLFIIAGRPSMGKSSIASQIAVNVAEQGNNVVMFTLETSKEQVTLKMALQRARISVKDLKSGNFSDRDMLRFVDSLGYLSELPIYMNDDSDITLEDMNNIIKLIEGKHGKISLIIIDYLQLLESKRKHDNRNQEIAYISRSIRKIGKHFECPVILLSQLSREVERRGDKRPIMSDLRESGAIEQDADIIGFIYRDEVYEPDSEFKGIAEIIIRKQRNGPLGTVKLAFIGQYMRFENLAR